MKGVVASVLLFFVLFMGCVYFQSPPEENATVTQTAPTSTPTGCSYVNPPCGPNYTCSSNKCIRSSLLSELKSHASVLESDSSRLAVLTGEGTAIIENYNVELDDFDKTYVVGVREIAYVNFYLKKGYVLQGTASVRGGSDNNIDFSLKGANGTAYIQKKRISVNNAFSFTAPVDGKYMIELGNMFTTFDVKQVEFDMLGSKFNYFQQYLSWSENYTSEAERMAQHLNSFEDFLSKNKDELKDAGEDSAALNNSILDSKIGLTQSIYGVKANIQNMRDYVLSEGGMQQQEQQQSAEMISALDRILSMLD